MSEPNAVEHHPGSDEPPARTAVFTGAGISGEEPAALPRGFELRDRILRFMYDTGRLAAPSAMSEGLLTEMTASNRKLEVVLGRLWGIIGDDALECLLALKVEVPNRAHMLAAVHLLGGGTHVTLNFDTGIESAADLLQGRRDLPAGAHPAFVAHLDDWRALIPSDAAPVGVISTRDEFDAWEINPRPALLKVHGSLTADQAQLADVVVVDNEELGWLHRSRRTAIDRLHEFGGLLVTGYSGVDPDVYRPLLRAAPPGTVWCCYSVDPSSALPTDLENHRIELRLGSPRGLAETALEELVGVRCPEWPQIRIDGEHFERRLAAWQAACTERHSPDRFAIAWAWLLADLGDHDAAAAILAELDGAAPADTVLLMRQAELFYSRAHDDDRERAHVLFARVARDRSVELGVRLHCRLRIADIARGKAIRAERRVPLAVALSTSLGSALWVIVRTRDGRADREAAADAYRLIEHTLMRSIERLAQATPRRAWLVLSMLCVPARAAGTRSSRLTSNGNLRIMLGQRDAHLRVLAGLLRGRDVHPATLTTLHDLHDTYWNADDRNGAANCTVSLALAAARHAPVSAREQLEGAEREYRQATSSGEPIPSAIALLAVARSLVDLASADGDAQRDASDTKPSPGQPQAPRSGR